MERKKKIVSNTFTFRITPEDMAKLRDIAKAQGVSVTRIIKDGILFQERLIKKQTELFNREVEKQAKLKEG